MKNDDFFAPWHDSRFEMDLFAPHNVDPDNPNRPWNKVFWNPMDLTKEERQYYGIDYDYYNFKKQNEYGKLRN